MNIVTLNETIAALLVEHDLDSRRCYTHVSAAPPDGREVVVECSDEGILGEIESSQAGAAQGAAIRYRWLRSGVEGLADGLVAASSVADVRKEATHTSELVTQIVYGDSAEPLKDDGEWVLCRLDDRYVGWVRSWHLTELSPKKQKRYKEEARHRIGRNHAEVLMEPREDALPVTDLVIGTDIVVTSCGVRGWRSVRLPDGKEGFVTARAVEPIPRRRRPSRDRLASTGLRFLGIPYIWGGTTPKGFDCSGLIQRVFRLNGLLVPRDADLQARFGRLKPTGEPDRLQTGDLLFFGKSVDHITHVAMVLPDGLFLHAYGQVRVGSLDPGHPLYEGKLASSWRLSRDPLVREA